MISIVLIGEVQQQTCFLGIDSRISYLTQDHKATGDIELSVVLALFELLRQCIHGGRPALLALVTVFDGQANGQMDHSSI